MRGVAPTPLTTVRAELTFDGGSKGRLATVKMKNPENTASVSTNHPGCSCTGESCSASVQQTAAPTQTLPSGEWAFWTRLEESCGGSPNVSHTIKVLVNGIERPECGGTYSGNEMCNDTPCNGPTFTCTLP